jgi:hypothetical protein
MLNKDFLGKMKRQTVAVIGAGEGISIDGAETGLLT